MLKHVSSLPKLDKSAYIQSYLQVQQKHAAAFADEGSAHIRTWTNPPPSPTKLPHDYGFGTPVLKPRVPQDTTNDDNKENALVNVKKPRSEATNSKRIQDKLPAIDSDEAIRLAERREKKRAKRTAMRPSGDDQDHNEDSKRNNSKSKFSVGLALMHGFSATNIGKNRLTINTVPKMGVFTKGKASAPARVAKKHGCQEAVRFSEREFLNSNLKSSSDSSSDDSLSSNSYAKINSPARRLSARNKVSSPAPAATPPKSKHKSQDDSTSKKAEIAVSEVWNIELEDFVLPSNVSQATTPNILGTQGFSWSQEGDRKDCNLSEVSEVQLVHCSPSLGPSQSASQCHLLPPVVSKYFSIPISQSPIDSLPSVATPQPDMPEVPWLASPSSVSFFEQAHCPLSSQLHIGDMQVLNPVSTVSDDLDVVSEVYLDLSVHDQVYNDRTAVISSSESFFQIEESNELSMDSGLAAADGVYEFEESHYFGDTEPIHYIPDTFSCDGMSWTGNDDWLEDVGMDVEECDFDASSGYANFPDHRFTGEAQTHQCPFFILDDCYDVKSDTSMASLPFRQGKELLHGLSECGGYQAGFTITSAEAEVSRSLKSHWFPQKL